MVRAPGWDPRGEGSLPQVHTINEVRGKPVTRQQALGGEERSVRAPQKILTAASRSAPGSHVQTINLVTYSRLLLTAQAAGMLIFPAAFYLSLFAVLEVTEMGKLFISYITPVKNSTKSSGNICHFSSAARCWTRTNLLYKHILGFLVVKLF